MASGAGLDSLEDIFLAAVGSDAGIPDTSTFADAQGVAHQVIVGLMNSLIAERYVVAKAFAKEATSLTDDAAAIMRDGSPEVSLFQQFPEEGLTDAEMDAKFGKDFVAAAKGKCMKNKWITRDKATGKYFKSVPSVEKDEVLEQLHAVRDGAAVDEKVLRELTSRKLVGVRWVGCSYTFRS